MESQQQAGSRYPWYDSNWLGKYVRAQELIQRLRPEKFSEFVQAFECLRTRADFQVKPLLRVFDDATLEEIKRIIRTFHLSHLEMHEINNFGRFVVHDHPFITELQQSITHVVSETAGELVEPSYNFVSLYKKLGRCPVHVDAPNAKWTLDLCVAQSEPWPIHISQIVPWPVNFTRNEDDWQESIKRSQDYQFSSYSPEPGNALVFSGSSQWHYRDPKPITGTEAYCHLVFFHFVPKGMREMVKPKNWARLFDIPELAEVA